MTFFLRTGNNDFYRHEGMVTATQQSMDVAPAVRFLHTICPIHPTWSELFLWTKAGWRVLLFSNPSSHVQLGGDMPWKIVTLRVNPHIELPHAHWRNLHSTVCLRIYRLGDRLCHGKLCQESIRTSRRSPCGLRGNFNLSL